MQADSAASSNSAGLNVSGSPPRLVWRAISACLQRAVHRLRAKRRNLARRTACKTDLRQPKVKHLGVSALGNENVRRFDVAVDDAFCVGCVERVRNLDSQRQNQLGFQRSASDAMLQRQAI
jgi:hypothetical protein